MVAGRWLRPEDEQAAVINSYLYRNERVKLGDNIILKVDGKKKNFRVVGIALGTGAPMIYSNYSYMAKITGNVGRATTLLILGKVRDQESISQMSQALQSHLKRMGFRIDTVQTMTQEFNEMVSNFSIVGALLLIMAILLAIVGGFSLMGTMSINVIERTREIGILRAIGASDIGVGLVFILEGVCIGLLSWASCLVIAFAIGKTISDAVGDVLLGVPLSYTFSMPGAWLWLVIIVIMSAAASFIPARSATRLTVREVLAYE
jgi:putative ABC transport system permease protein